MGAPGPDGSASEVAERRCLPGALPPRASFTLSYADGGSLELGTRTVVMGVVNVTPDSFSDGGLHLDPDRALAAAARMAEEGADLVDIGGESTRPGADPVDEAEETRRVVPVIEAIRRELSIRISLDTRKAAVARRAFDAGADMVNDVSALADPEMLPLLGKRRAPAILMHMRGTPDTMQRDTLYDDVVRSVVGFLGERVARAVSGGLAGDKILVDPGIGFGKDVAGNLSILQRLGEFEELGRPIVVGASRKSFIGAVLDAPVDRRLEGSLAVAAWASALGAHVIRVHDVAATVRVVRMIDAIRGA